MKKFSFTLSDCTTCLHLCLSWVSSRFAISRERREKKGMCWMWMCVIRQPKRKQVYFTETGFQSRIIFKKWFPFSELICTLKMGRDCQCSDEDELGECVFSVWVSCYSVMSLVNLLCILFQRELDLKLWALAHMSYLRVNNSCQFCLSVSNF